jgi:hypothetical protein
MQKLSVQPNRTNNFQNVVGWKTLWWWMKSKRIIIHNSLYWLAVKKEQYCSMLYTCKTAPSITVKGLRWIMGNRL